jgi:hypothetical protein
MRSDIRNPQREEGRICNHFGEDQVASLASRKPFVPRLAAVIDIGRLHFWAVGELSQQVKDLRVAVLRHQPVDVVSPAAPARLANDRQHRFADVRTAKGRARGRSPSTSWYCAERAARSTPILRNSRIVLTFSFFEIHCKNGQGAPQKCNRGDFWVVRPRKVT